LFPLQAPRVKIYASGSRRVRPPRYGCNAAGTVSEPSAFW